MYDHGYSNYTVEGTEADCLFDLNPFFPVDNWYNDAEEHDFANVCSRFKEGYPMHVDVECEEGHIINYTDDPEVKDILSKIYMIEVLSGKHDD